MLQKLSLNILLTAKVDFIYQVLFWLRLQDKHWCLRYL